MTHSRPLEHAVGNGFVDPGSFHGVGDIGAGRRKAFTVDHRVHRPIAGLHGQHDNKKRQR